LNLRIQTFPSVDYLIGQTYIVLFIGVRHPRSGERRRCVMYGTIQYCSTCDKISHTASCDIFCFVKKKSFLIICHFTVKCTENNFLIIWFYERICFVMTQDLGPHFSQ
jgi:hypothetical protein